MASGKEDPVQAFANSPLREVIVKGFAELYRVKPDFPVEFLGQWLKSYSQSQSRMKHLEETKVQKEEQVAEMERNLLEKAKKAHEVPLDRNRLILKRKKKKQNLKPHLSTKWKERITSKICWTNTYQMQLKNSVMKEEYRSVAATSESSNFAIRSSKNTAFNLALSLIPRIPKWLSM